MTRGICQIGEGAESHPSQENQTRTKMVLLISDKNQTRRKLDFFCKANLIKILNQQNLNAHVDGIVFTPPPINKNINLLFWKKDQVELN